MSEADKLYEELGYKMICSHLNPSKATNYQFIYENKENSPTRIEFSKSEMYGNKLYISQRELFNNLYDNVLPLDVLKAINTKCKELGWI